MAVATLRLLPIDAGLVFPVDQLNRAVREMSPVLVRRSLNSDCSAGVSDFQICGNVLASMDSLSYICSYF